MVGGDAGKVATSAGSPCLRHQQVNLVLTDDGLGHRRDGEDRAAADIHPEPAGAETGAREVAQQDWGVIYTTHWRFTAPGQGEESPFVYHACVYTPPLSMQEGACAKEIRLYGSYHGTPPLRPPRNEGVESSNRVDSVLDPIHVGSNDVRGCHALRGDTADCKCLSNESAWRFGGHRCGGGCGAALGKRKCGTCYRAQTALCLPLLAGAGRHTRREGARSGTGTRRAVMRSDKNIPSGRNTRLDAY